MSNPTDFVSRRLLTKGPLRPIEEEAQGQAPIANRNASAHQTNVQGQPIHVQPAETPPPRVSRIRTFRAESWNAVQKLVGGGAKPGPTLEEVTNFPTAVSHTLNLFTSRTTDWDRFIAFACCGVARGNRSQEECNPEIRAELAQMTDCQLIRMRNGFNREPALMAGEASFRARPRHKALDDGRHAEGLTSPTLAGAEVVARAAAAGQSLFGLLQNVMQERQLPCPDIAVGNGELNFDLCIAREGLLKCGHANLESVKRGAERVTNKVIRHIGIDAGTTTV